MIFLFNRNCAIINAYQHQYFVVNLIQQNNRSLINALESIIHPILNSVNVVVALITQKIKQVIYHCNDAKKFEQEVGLLDSNNRYSCYVLGMTKNNKDKVDNLMMYTGATLYQLVVELVYMTQLSVDNNMKEWYSERKVHCQTYPVDPRKQSDEESIESIVENKVIKPNKIENELVISAIDMLADMKEAFDHALSMIYDFQLIFIRYKKS